MSRQQPRSIWFPPAKPVDGTLVLTNPGRVAKQEAKKNGTEIEYIDFRLLKKHVWAFDQDGDWQYPAATRPGRRQPSSLSSTIRRAASSAGVGTPTRGRLRCRAVLQGSGKNRQLALLHPDFIFVREVDSELVVDIIDLHLDHGASRDQWLGLAGYVSEHSQVIQRAIVVVHRRE